jgi:hypothetical protein
VCAEAYRCSLASRFFLLWLITRHDSLLVAGLWTICGGLLLFTIGAGALAQFCSLAFRTPDLPRRRLWLSTLGGAALLLANFPVAAGLIAAAIAIETRYTVRVRNASQQPLSGVRVVGGGCDADFGTVAPGTVVRRSFWIQLDGELEFHAVSGATAHTETIDDYVTDGDGGDTTVTIDPDGTISISHERPRGMLSVSHKRSRTAAD